MAGTTTNDDEHKVKLRRVIGLFDAISIILGTIIGSGIFITPGGVLGEVSSVYMSLVIWILCGLVSILGAFCFAELAYLVPKNGAGYAYLYEAFSGLSRFGDIPAFLSCWMSTIIVGPGSVAVMALTSSQYLSLAIFGSCSVDDLVNKCMAAVLIILMTAMNCYSVKLSTRINSIFSVGKVLAIILIIIFGVINIFKGRTSNLKLDFQKSEKNPAKYATAFYYGLFTYDGWISLNNLTEELKNPKRNLPLAMAIGLITIIVLYITVYISYLTVLTPQEMVYSKAVALTWADNALGRYSVVILLGVFISVSGSALGTLISDSRITFAASRDAELPIILGMIDKKRMTPTPSVLFAGLISLIMIIFSSIFDLLEFFTFLIWIFYGLNIVSLLVLRRRKTTSNENTSNSNQNSGYRLRLPIVFPIIMLLFSIALTALSLADPKIDHLIALIITFAGLVYYFIFVFFKKKFFITDKITEFLALLLDVTSETVDVEKML